MIQEIDIPLLNYRYFMKALLDCREKIFKRVRFKFLKYIKLYASYFRCNNKVKYNIY